MNTNHKPRSVEPPQHVRELAGTEQSKEYFDKAAAATSDAAHVVQSCWTNALKGMQEYNDKLAEFAQTNTKAHLEFMQKLAGLRSPTEFLELSTQHTQRQFERLTDQGKLLSALAQRVTLETAEPIKAGFAKIQEKAA